MGKFNRAFVFSAPLIIYALGLWGSRQALIGTIVYMVWIFMGLDEAEYRAKKPTEGADQDEYWRLYFNCCSFANIGYNNSDNGR